VPRLIPILIALLVVTGGCHGPRYNVEDQPPAGDMQPVVQRVTPAPPPSAVGASRAEVPSVRVSAPWVVVSDWARARHLEAPERISMSTRPVFELRSGRGALAFQTGTTQARFNGMILLLGFEPRLFAGEVCLHELDVTNNLEPLLLGKPFCTRAYHTVVIDPGHGGGNTGTRSAGGALEKEYTLDWALRLRPLLETNGWTVFLTRTNDSERTLPERVAFADAAGADLFISLHFNASGGGTYQAGLETYCLTPVGMPSSLTREFDDDWNVAYPNNAFDTPNLQLAALLHKALLRVNGGEDRGIRRARFMGVLRGQKRPAVLIEGGFLSNPEEAAGIADPNHRQTLAEAVAAALGSPREGQVSGLAPGTP